MKKAEDKEVKDNCPKCGAKLSEPTLTKTGRKLRRCSQGEWDPKQRATVGCDYVLWMEVEPEKLEEKCPKCGNALIMQFTRFGKKMKKCSAGTWNKETKKVDGCDFVEWINGTKEELDEECPDCGEKLILFTTNAGKKMKKCSTAGWDPKKKKATGCTYIYWLKPHEYPEKVDNGGEEFLPPEPEE